MLHFFYVFPLATKHVTYLKQSVDVIKPHVAKRGNLKKIEDRKMYFSHG